MASNGTRSLDITQNLLRLYCHIFPQFQCFEESGYVCGMVEDLFDHGEENNAGRVCCEVYAMYSSEKFT